MNARDSERGLEGLFGWQRHQDAPASLHRRERSGAKERTYLFYQPKDFILYLFSLAITGGAACLAFESAWARVLVAAGLLYMAVTFIMKRGIEIDLASLLEIARGVLAYPMRLARSLQWRIMRTPLALFAVAMIAELVCKRFVHGETFWLHRFPTTTVWAACFGTVTLYRTIILIAHLRRSQFVQRILETSPWKTELKRLSIRNHLIHGYVTGIVSHICTDIPLLIVWRFLPPTILRETILFARIAVVAVRTITRGAGRTERPVGLLDESRVRALTLTHAEDHQSRFFFTVFHGHHHDAVPSAVMASNASGLVEAIHRSIYLVSFLSGAAGLMLSSVVISLNMITHQYIPGVYPYARTVVRRRSHHAIHHYGSLRPLGLGGLPSYAYDLAQGYDPNNGKVKWFLDAVKEHEKIDDADCAKFVELR